MTLGSMLETSGVTPDDVVTHVSSLSPSLRHTECLALTRNQQRRLWLLVSADAGEQVGELVPGTAAVFAGRNSLQLFSRFEKWFARQDGAIVGCNLHGLSSLIGPGYFTVRVDGSQRLEFDYGSLPSQAPAGWPEIRGNSGLLARPVYGDLLDRVLWISPDVLVGAAFRRGAPLDSYFVIVRAAR